MEEKNKEKENRPKFDFEKLQGFLANNPSFTEKDGAKAIFSLGVLVQLVFSIQQANLRSTPFESKLKGLHLSAKDVNRIFKDSVEKVNQYTNQYTYKDLREFIAENLIIHKPEIDKMSNNEISFNFVCGLELGRKFKS